MTIAQRIELRRLGYTKEEVAEMVEQEKAVVMAEPVEEATEPEAAPIPVEPEAAPIPVEPATEQPAAMPSTADLLAAINNLTTALQMQRIATTQQPEAAVKPMTAEDVMNDYLKG